MSGTDENGRRRHRPYYPPLDHHEHVYPTLPHQGTYGYAIEPAWLEYMQQHGYHASYGYPPYPLHLMEGVPLPPGIPGLGGSTDPLEAVLGPFPCAQLNNLPYDASLEDILLLFQGLVVIDVVLIGQGEAFVVFANPMDFQMALQRDRQSIGRRFIEISPASRAEYYEAIAKQHLQEQELSTPLQSGGTSSVGAGDESMGGEQQIVGETGSTAAAAAALWRETSGPQSLQSYQTQAGYSEQMLHHGLAVPGSGLSSRGGEGRGLNLHAPTHKRTGGGIQVGEHTGYLRMRGLPFSATKEDIYTFFGNFNPILESIVLTYRNDGRATGEAYVGFATADDSKCAMDLHRRMMGSRYIELFISNKDEQGRALVRFGNR